MEQKPSITVSRFWAFLAVFTGKIPVLEKPVKTPIPPPGTNPPPKEVEGWTSK